MSAQISSLQRPADTTSRTAAVESSQARSGGRENNDDSWAEYPDDWLDGLDADAIVPPAVPSFAPASLPNVPTTTTTNTTNDGVHISVPVAIGSDACAR